MPKHMQMVDLVELPAVGLINSTQKRKAVCSSSATVESVWWNDLYFCWQENVTPKLNNQCCDTMSCLTERSPVAHFRSGCLPIEQAGTVIL